MTNTILTNAKTSSLNETLASKDLKENVNSSLTAGFQAFWTRFWSFTEAQEDKNTKPFDGIL